MGSFRKWLEIYGGHTPPRQEPTLAGSGSNKSMGFADFHGPEGADPSNPSGELPPVAKRRQIKRMRRKG